MKLDELYAKRSKLLADAQAALESNEANDVRFKKHDDAITEMRSVSDEIRRHEETNKLSEEQRKREQEAEERARAGRPALPQPGAQQTEGEERSDAEDREAAEKRSRQLRKAFTSFVRSGNTAELRALGSTVGSQGGVTIPTITLAGLEQAMLTYGGVAGHVYQLPTANGDPFSWPTTNDTANAGSAIGENVQTTEVDPAFAATAITVGLFQTNSVLVPRTLIQDSVIDVGSVVASLLAQRRARLLSQLLTGGVVNANFDSILGVTVGATSASPTAISLTDMLGIYGAVDPAYAVGGKFVMHRNTQLYLSGLRNAYGTPIFPVDQSGLLTKFAGSDVVIDQNFPAVGTAPTATSKYVVFGDLQKYILRPVGDVEVLRLEERYADYNQVGFMGFWRAGGRLLDAGTHPIQALQQHA